jgi:VWFA-related protein
MSLRVSSALALCAAAVAAAGLSAEPQARQQGKPSTQEPTTTFRSATSLVEVDIIVKDKDGRFVSGLTADDFEVLEEGKPQPIQHFYLVTENPTGASGQVRPDMVLPRLPDQQGRRVLVVFFDAEHLSVSTIPRVKQAAMDFLNEHFRPFDMGGVFVNGSLWRGRMSNDRQELLDGIRALTPWFETPATRLGSLTEFPRISSEFEAVRVDAGDRRVLDELVQRACQEQPTECSFEGGAETVQMRIEHKAQAYVRDARRAARITADSLTYLARNLARLEGRKTLVMISEGFFTDELRAELSQLAGQASRAGITIYALNARGTIATGGRILPDASLDRGTLSTLGDSSEEGLDVLASETGGMSIRHTDNFVRALDRIVEDTSTYYVLAYSPENTLLDGKFRRIQLKTKWQGLEVRARRGYVATPLPPPKPIRAGGQ